MPNCKTYQKKGGQAAREEGYSTQDMAKCNIEAIKKGLPRPGTNKWKPSGGRRTRKSRGRRNRQTRRK